MDSLRLERLVWAVLVGLIVAVPLGFLLAPDPTGLVPLALAAVAFLVSVPLVFRAFSYAASPTADPGDMTAEFVVFFAVTLTVRLALGALNFDGFAGNLVSFGAGWIAASYVPQRLNPRRWVTGA
ncbi:hypothetical protein C499_14660 [Halogeometricum borinquense DSM 11551]|uniref:Uncharacterized protein n=1 Tax=Halogeometricum borinquense (strain ATCC 700274 / DSM 11551 / JCM 10706 / KCTC 4070 / PR3) TaxID=469382 RepID=E4NL58_HALBP|nr:hypothetical protein [Halogeometricum borinquense]ADQ68307.1 hypothetical protein Hbor_27630 [Halogeometricum borinquense DSM 11551]ELY24651.1 hypothetical protein C499_14660 [Halogeometricum borinquense DSM 11551]